MNINKNALPLQPRVFPKPQAAGNGNGYIIMPPQDNKLFKSGGLETPNLDTFGVVAKEELSILGGYLADLTDEQVKDLEKKAAILDAAKKLFPQRGFDGVSMEAIAAEAGVSKLTVYNHFTDKETLFSAAVKQRCEELLPHEVFEVDVSSRPIGELLGYYGRNSLILGVAAFALTYLIGIPLGVLAAAKRDTWVDQLATGVGILGMGMPNFWLALLLIMLFSSTLRLLPSAGCCSPKHLILPAVVLAAEGIAVTLRMMRSSMLEQLGNDYVRTHRAKGLRERTVVGSRVFRNALIPVISLSGLRLGWLIGYALIVETIFQWPGVGYLLVDSILRRDYPVA